MTLGHKVTEKID